MQLYLDCAGVLADFDAAATELLRMPPADLKSGTDFWSSGSGWRVTLTSTVRYRSCAMP